MKRSLIHIALLACLLSGTAMAQVQVGNNANATALEATAVGDNAHAVTDLSTAIGARALADGGMYEGAPCVGATAVGNEATSLGCSTTSLGHMSQANGPSATAVGARAESLGVNSSAFGAGASASNGGTAIGSNTSATTHGSAFGSGSSVTGARGTAMGAMAKADADDCIALGSFSECTSSDEVSVGNAGYGISRRVTNLANGINDTDAASVGQLRTIATAIGGGANFVNGFFVPPTITLSSGNTHNNVTAAIYDLDGRLHSLEQNPASGPQGPAGPAGASAYQVAVSNGFAGSEADWLASLKGDRGDAGPQGPAGQDGQGSGSNRYFQANGNNDGSDDAQADKLGSVAAGRNAASRGFGDVAIGEDSEANSGLDGRGAVAVGPSARAQGPATTAIGEDATAQDMGSTALGKQATARDGSLAAGSGSAATGHVSTAVGPGAQASARAASAFGNNAQAQQANATAVGAATVAHQNGTAVGTGSAAGVNGTAVGFGAQATHTNSVAIGANTRTTGSNQVAMGYRQVTQVADGRVAAGSTDAVNGGQLWNLQESLDDRWIEIDRRFDHTDKRINGLGAQTAAMAQMAAAGGPYGLAVGEVAVNAGVGFYGNEAAIAVGWSTRLTERVNVSAGLSFGSGKTKPMGGVGISIRLGR